MKRKPLPDEALTEQEMESVMHWLFLYARRRGCGEQWVAVAENENAQGHAKALEDILIQAFRPDIQETREIAVHGKEAVAKRKSLKVPEPWQDDWSEEAKNLLKEHYWDEWDRQMDVHRFVIDRLRSEKCRGEILECFEVKFESILHKSIAMCLNGTDCPLLFFKFDNDSNCAYWVRKAKVPATMRSDVDDLFEDVGKPRPYDTPSARSAGSKTETKGQGPDAVLAEGEISGMMRWVYLVGRDFEKAEIVEKAEMATEQAERGEEPDEESLEALRRLLRIRRGRFRPPATREEHDSRARPLFGNPDRPARPWALGLREWICQNRWTKDARDFLGDRRYFSSDKDDGVYGRLFIRNRLESEQGRGKLVKPYRTDFRVLEGRYEPAEELQALVGDQPEMLWFEFKEVNGLAFGVSPDGFTIDARKGIKGRFAEEGKRLPKSWRRSVRMTAQMEHAGKAQAQGAIRVGFLPSSAATQIDAAEAERILSESRRLEQIERDDPFTDIIIGKTQPIRDVITQMQEAAASDVIVLILGESGAGKELVAKGIHDDSSRATHPWKSINVATLVERLAGAELFGHSKGAYTGADIEEPGLIKSANKGTLFLDEIGDLKLDLQPLLLRVLDNGVVQRIGDREETEVDVRFIAATNKDLREKIKAKQFREDLYYRLRVYEIRVPALRERRADIPALVRHLLKRHPKTFVNPDVMPTLIRRGWPGNIRDLKNCIDAAAARARDDDTITTKHFQFYDLSDNPEVPIHSEPTDKQIKRELEDKGHVGKAASTFGLNRHQLGRLCKDRGIRPGEHTKIGRRRMKGH